MRRFITVALVCAVAVPGVALAADRPLAAGNTALARHDRQAVSQPLAASVVREARRLATAPQPGTREERPRTDGAWLGRHPVVFGTIVGAGIGAVAGMTMENELFCSGGDEDCLIYGGTRFLAGAGMGAGIGALAGLVVSLAR
jgi:hypothetical protein